MQVGVTEGAGGQCKWVTDVIVSGTFYEQCTMSRDLQLQSVTAGNAIAWLGILFSDKILGTVWQIFHFYKTTGK